MPPHLAPIQVVIVPIYRSEEQLAQISEKVNGIVANLKKMGISVKFDDADNKKPGWKFAEYELKGVPVRLAMGGRDLENNTIEVMRRDTLEKETITCDGIEEYVQNLLEEIQQNIFRKALDHRTASTITVDTYEEFKEKIEEGLLSWLTGTVLPKQKSKSRTKPKQLSVVYLWQATRHRVNAWLPANLLHNAYCLHGLTKRNTYNYRIERICLQKYILFFVTIPNHTP